MKNKAIVGAILVIFILSGSILAQEIEQKTEFPYLTLRQKWQRATNDLNLFIIAGISYVKSQGKPVADFGKYLGELFAPNWEEVKGKGVWGFVEGIYRNWQVLRGFNMRLLSITKTSIEAKIQDIGEASLETWTESGVTKEDYFRFYGQLMVTITDYLGLEYKQEVEEDWIYFTVTEKK